MDKDTAEVLADLCNADLAAIRIEIEKLATYVGPGQPIRRADVDALVVSEKKYSVWELADMLAAGQRAKALVFLDSLLREGEAPPALVGAMAWMYRKLLEAKELGPHASGYQAAARLSMRPAAAEMAVRQAQKIPRQQLVDGLRALYDADSRLKSGAKDHRAVMEFLVAQLMSAKPAPCRRGTSGRAPSPGNSPARNAAANRAARIKHAAHARRQAQPSGCALCAATSPWRTRFSPCFCDRNQLRLRRRLRRAYRVAGQREARLVAVCRIPLENALGHRAVDGRDRRPQQFAGHGGIAGANRAAQGLDHRAKL